MESAPHMTPIISFGGWLKPRRTALQLPD